ncbi:transglutaminase domain-containing protein [Methylocella sp.]|uniref:transglutaminase family protein n=1 Tax=Methylocella sp. TaxID=1978226 RepID=UPI003783200D
MARIEIVHRTDYLYRNPVGLGTHRLMLRPRDSHDLRLNHASLNVDPQPSAVRWAHDVFNNSVCYLSFDPEIRVEKFSVVSSLNLTHYPIGADLPPCSLDPAAELFPFSYPSQEIADLARLAERQEPDPKGAVDAWARRFVSGPGETRTLKLLSDMTHAIKDELKYGARHEEGTQSAAETLERGTGTCRDFAVLMMEAARALNLAARFVTGYLYEEDTRGELRGGASTHAWCSVYLPGAGWVEYDPTNGLLAGQNLVRVAETRLASQALPISGGYIGAPDDTLRLDVCVAVKSAPLKPAKAAEVA